MEAPAGEEADEAQDAADAKPRRPTFRRRGIDVEPDAVHVTAIDVGNRWFALCADTEYGGGPEMRGGVWVLVLEKERVVFPGGHATTGVRFHPTVTLAAEGAERIAAALEVPLARRLRPAHALATELVAEAAIHRPGEEVWLELSIRNVGLERVSLEHGGWQRGANRHGLFSLRVSRAQELLRDIGRTRNLGGLRKVAKLDPGEVFVERVDAARWCAFDLPGEYTIEARYPLVIVEPRAPFDVGHLCPVIAEQVQDETVEELTIRVE